MPCYSCFNFPKFGLTKNLTLLQQHLCWSSKNLKMVFCYQNCIDLYGWSFSISGLKTMVKSGLEFFFVKFLHALSIIWIYLIERRIFGQKYKFSNKNDMVSTWRNFKNIFSRPLFTIIFSFRPEMLKFHPYSILTKVEFVKLSYTIC